MLESLFEQFRCQKYCVVLNACYKETQANKVAEHIFYVVGMPREIDGNSSIIFSVGYYQALSAGRSVNYFYNLGNVQIRLH